MIQVRFQVSINFSELNSGGNTFDILQIRDSATSRFVALKYTPAGDAVMSVAGFYLFHSTGGVDPLTIEQSIAADQLEAFTINMFPQAGGFQKVHLYHAGVYFGNFVTPQPFTPDSVAAGAMRTGNGNPVDRTFKTFTVGRSGGAHDIFTDGGYATNSVAPPWTTQAGVTFTIEGYTFQAQGQLRLSNAGTAAFVTKTFDPPGGPPGGPPPIGPPPGPSGLIFVGDSSWKQAGAERWMANGWELDRVVIPFRGDIDGLKTFLDGMTLWSPWDSDGNMFLENYPQDEHKQFPTVNLTFLGKRAGKLPPDRHELSSSIQQASGIVFSDAYILTFGLPPHWTARLTYISATSRVVTWSREVPNFDGISPPAPPALTADDIVSLVMGGVDYTVWPVAAANYAGIVAWVLRWFMQRTARYTSSQELVPGEYYRAEVTEQILLLPIQEEIEG